MSFPKEFPKESELLPWELSFTSETSFATNLVLSFFKPVTSPMDSELSPWEISSFTSEPSFAADALFKPFKSPMDTEISP